MDLCNFLITGTIISSKTLSMSDIEEKTNDGSWWITQDPAIIPNEHNNTDLPEAH